MLIKFIFFIIFSLCIQKSFLQATLPNITFLARGYDIYKGNPLVVSESSDPGFSNISIFALTYNTSKMSTDQQWLIPDNTVVTLDNYCELSFNSAEILEIRNYTDSLDQHVITKYEGWGPRYSASHDYQLIFEGLTHNNSRPNIFANDKKATNRKFLAFLSDK